MKMEIGGTRSPYTERDVREKPLLTELAKEYLQKYGGTFEPLVRAQRVLGAGHDLTPAIVKTVLNCMRHDTSVAEDMPDPGEWIYPEMKKQTTTGKKSKKPPKLPYECDRTDFHPEHHGDTIQGYCQGIHEINRNRAVRMPATVKRPFVIAKTGFLIHIPVEAWFAWLPKSHEWGYHMHGTYRQPENQQVDDVRFPSYGGLTVRVCKYPSILHQPKLITVEEAKMLVSTGERHYCMSCFENEAIPT